MTLQLSRRDEFMVKLLPLKVAKEEATNIRYYFIWNTVNKMPNIFECSSKASRLSPKEEEEISNSIVIQYTEHG